MTEEKETFDTEAINALAVILNARVHELVVAFHKENEEAPDFTVVYSAVTTALMDALADSMVAGSLCCNLAPEWTLGQAVTGISMSFCHKLAEVEDKGDETESVH